jgi:hypothetical protein
LFCEVSDISIPWKKITRGLPRARQAANDRAPTIEEIQKIVEYPDRRIKPIGIQGGTYPDFISSNFTVIVTGPPAENEFEKSTISPKISFCLITQRVSNCYPLVELP